MLETFTDRTFGEDFTRLTNAVEKLASAAVTAANAYAKKVEQPTFVVNVNHEPNVHTSVDVVNAVKAALRNRGVQDR